MLANSNKDKHSRFTNHQQSKEVLNVSSKA
uniref:Uncharacterized protein n=1 Tax=Rhizophora mucronata TaxID=61149 RepID=A0A2P2P853_RHIMU